MSTPPYPHSQMKAALDEPSASNDQRRGVIRDAAASNSALAADETNKRQRCMIAPSFEMPSQQQQQQQQQGVTNVVLAGTPTIFRPEEMTRDASLQVIRNVLTQAPTSATLPALVGNNSGMASTANWLQYANLMDMQQNQRQPFAFGDLPVSNDASWQRQQVFGNLAAAAAAASSASPLSAAHSQPTTIDPAVWLSLMASQPALQPMLWMQSPHVNQYLMMHNMNRSLQHQGVAMGLRQPPFPQFMTSAGPQGLLSPAAALPFSDYSRRSIEALTAAAGVATHGSCASSASPQPSQPSPSWQRAPRKTGNTAGAFRPVKSHQVATSSSLAQGSGAAMDGGAASTGGTGEDDIPLCLPVVLTRRTDHNKLSKLQNLLRQQIEVFQATEDDISTHIRGRNKSIHLGQVGIRCRHCTDRPILNRFKGSMYFPTSIWGFYQASQNMLGMHLQAEGCQAVPALIRTQFGELLDTKHAAPTSGAGRPYWAETAKQLGLVDTCDGIYFCRNLPPNVRLPEDNDNGANPGVYRKINKVGMGKEVSSR